MRRWRIKMKIQFRKLTQDDLGVFIQMRLHQLQEEGAEPVIDLEPALNEYYTKHLADNTFVSWIAVDGENIVATSGISFIEKPPYYSNPTGKIGLLSSMYTLKEYRRKGIAKQLLAKVVNEAKNYGYCTVKITASDMGVLLYTDFGFQKNGNFMQYMVIQDNTR